MGWPQPGGCKPTPSDAGYKAEDKAGDEGWGQIVNALEHHATESELHLDPVGVMK